MTSSRLSRRRSRPPQPEIADGPLLIIERDCFGVVHAEQDFFGRIDAHIMDRRAERMVTRLDGQKKARIGLHEPLGVVARKRAPFVDPVHQGPSQRE
jgi:hypothetical protein